MQSTFRSSASRPRNASTRSLFAIGLRNTARNTQRSSAPKRCRGRAQAVGAIEAAIELSEIPLTIIEPTAWKKFHQLRGGDKEAGRQRALQLFPAAHALLARKKDHGRAEAALIALAWHRTEFSQIHLRDLSSGQFPVNDPKRSTEGIAS
jgi:hypothetical protein